MTSAIRLNHDYLQIDIGLCLIKNNANMLDSDQNTLHFKVETEAEFERWTSLFEKFSHVLMKAASQSGGLPKAGITDDLLSDKNSFCDSLIANSNLENLHDGAALITSTLKNELMKMKDLIEAS